MRNALPDHDFSINVQSNYQSTIRTYFSGSALIITTTFLYFLYFLYSFLSFLYICTHIHIPTTLYRYKNCIKRWIMIFSRLKFSWWISFCLKKVLWRIDVILYVDNPQLRRYSQIIKGKSIKHFQVISPTFFYIKVSDHFFDWRTKS